MRFRLGLVTGFATGYYLGSKAGRQRYDQINRQLAKLRRSEAFEQAADRAKTVVEEGVEKARSVVDSRGGNGNGYGSDDGSVASGIVLPAETGPTRPTGLTGPTGLSDDTGLTGPTGLSDDTGLSGLSDDTGLSGPTGEAEPPPGLGGYSSSR